MRSGIPVETATRVYRRYLKLEPTHVEEYIAYLKKQVSFCCSSSQGFFPILPMKNARQSQ